VGYLRTQNQTYLDNAKKVSALFHACMAAIIYIYVIIRHGLGVSALVLILKLVLNCDFGAIVEQSGMRNSQGLWNDGLDLTSCKNDGQVRSTVWRIDL
jgi:hypothetical protein